MLSVTFFACSETSVVLCSVLLSSSSSPPALIHAPLTLDIYHISILDVQGHSRFRGLLTLFLCSFWVTTAAYLQLDSSN